MQSFEIDDDDIEQEYIFYVCQCEFVVTIIVALFSTLSSCFIINIFGIINNQIRGILSIIFSIASLFLICCKCCLVWEERPTGYSKDERKNLNQRSLNSSLMVFVTTVDCTFDILAGIALINDNLSYLNYSIYVIIGTSLGTTDEIIELIERIICCALKRRDYTICLHIMKVLLAHAELWCLLPLYNNVQYKIGDDNAAFVILTVLVVLQWGFICFAFVLIKAEET